MDMQWSMSDLRAQPFPRDFQERLDGLKKLTGLSWKEFAACLGVKHCRVMRCRKGMSPEAGVPEAMLLAAWVVPGGVETMLLDTAGCTRRAG